MPQFGGSKGPEIKKNLEELESMFAKHLKDIQNLDYDILDVKITKWHDDYGQRFKENMKNLEIMYMNTISLSFKNITTIQEGCEMVENFDKLAKRQPIKDFVHKNATEWVYNLFLEELKQVEEIHEQSKQEK